jgi:16S rRNA A1518/A1519 N6-dimethyltransferase RsmA/KsgA/DIM1 with predicted DNA glycosylase/AP lyase activity
VQAIFGQRRKQMRRVVRVLYGVAAEQAEQSLAQCDIPVDARPETLAPPAFARLLRAMGGEPRAAVAPPRGSR